METEPVLFSTPIFGKNVLYSLYAAHLAQPLFNPDVLFSRGFQRESTYVAEVVHCRITQIYGRIN